MVKMDMLKQWLEANPSVTVADIAEKCGVSRTAVYNWISGESQPTATAITKIAAATGGDLTVAALVAASTTTKGPEPAPPARRRRRKR